MLKISSHRRPARAAALGLATLLVCAGCTIPTAEERGAQSNNTSSVTSTSRTATATVRTATITPEQRQKMQAAWNEFRSQHPGEISIAIVPVGAGKDVRPIVLGKPASRVAAGTLRAPVAIAAQKYLKGDAQLLNNIVASLNANDAKAAAEVWKALGDGDGATAAQKTTRVLRLAGDTTTRVASNNPEMNTTWGLPAQARFTSGLACMPDAELVRDSLQPGLPTMSYGFGTDGFNLVLSGWVELPGAGSNMVGRQFAIVDKGKAGFSAVAVSAKALDGSRKSAEKLLTTVARWLKKNKFVPAGRCP